MEIGIILASVGAFFGGAVITMVFGFCGGECGVMGWIKTTKERQTDRRWQIEDEKRTEEATNLAETSEWNDP